VTGPWRRRGLDLRHHRDQHQVRLAHGRQVQARAQGQGVLHEESVQGRPRRHPGYEASEGRGCAGSGASGRWWSRRLLDVVTAALSGQSAPAAAPAAASATAPSASAAPTAPVAVAGRSRGRGEAAASAAAAAAASPAPPEPPGPPDGAPPVRTRLEQQQVVLDSMQLPDGWSFGLAQLQGGQQRRRLRRRQAEHRLRRRHPARRVQRRARLRLPRLRCRRWRLLRPRGRVGRLDRPTPRLPSLLRTRMPRESARKPRRNLSKSFLLPSFPFLFPCSFLASGLRPGACGAGFFLSLPATLRVRV